MAMGKGPRRARQASMWVADADLARTAGHPLYKRLNRVLDEAGFDAFVEAQCAKFYADGIGRPSLPPGRYFRMLLLGYFEGLASERAMAWRAADSLSLRQFLDIALAEASPDHSTVWRTRRRIDVETHEAVFTWVLQRVADAGLLKGKTVGIDATTLEANAALRSIVRRDTGEGYDAFLRGLAAASGIATPTRAELARLDRKRRKKGSNKDWTHPKDPDAKITKMKDGRTHLAHKAEHAVDVETGAIVGVTVQDASAGDTTTMVEMLITATEQVEAVLRAGGGVAEVVADKGYHSNETMVALADLGLRSYVSEPDRGRRRWRGQLAVRDAVYANRRRIRRPRHALGTRHRQWLGPTQDLSAQPDDLTKVSGLPRLRQEKTSHRRARDGATALGRCAYGVAVAGGAVVGEKAHAGDGPVEAGGADPLFHATRILDDVRREPAQDAVQQPAAREQQRRGGHQEPVDVASLHGVDDRGCGVGVNGGGSPCWQGRSQSGNHDVMPRQNRLQDLWVASVADADFQSLLAEIAEPAFDAHQRGDRVASAQRAAKDFSPGSPVGAQQNDVHAHLFRCGHDQRAAEHLAPLALRVRRSVRQGKDEQVVPEARAELRRQGCEVHHGARAAGADRDVLAAVDCERDRKAGDR